MSEVSNTVSSVSLGGEEGDGGRLKADKGERDRYMYPYPVSLYHSPSLPACLLDCII